MHNMEEQVLRIHGISVAADAGRGIFTTYRLGYYYALLADGPAGSVPQGGPLGRYGQ